MRRGLRVCFLIALSCMGIVASAQEEETVDVESRIQILEQRSSEMGNRLVRFLEKRTFPFRNKATELEGIARISESFGVSIEYPSKDAVMIVDDEGMILRRLKEDRIGREKKMPAKEGEMADLIAATMQFDREKLMALFDASAIGNQSDWTLELSPKADDLKVSKISIQSGASEVRQIVIELEGGRSIAIEIASEEKVEMFADSERNRYFRSVEDQ